MRPPRTGPFFGYYGSKWLLSRRMPPPEHGLIVEPFAGSACYALRYRDRDVLLVEKDPDLVGVWDFIIHATADDFLSIGDVPDGGTVDDIDAPHGGRLLVGFWLNRGSSRPCKSPSSWARSGLAPSSFWGPRVRERLAAMAGTVRHWKITHGDYTLAPDVTATWFVDPPYEVAGSHYAFGSSGISYTDLGAWCRSRSGLTIVCENYGAQWLPFASIGDVRTARRGRRSHEATWVSRSVC